MVKAYTLVNLRAGNECDVQVHSEVRGAMVSRAQNWVDLGFTQGHLYQNDSSFSLPVCLECWVDTHVHCDVSLPRDVPHKVQSSQHPLTYSFLLIDHE